MQVMEIRDAIQEDRSVQVAAVSTKMQNFIVRFRGFPTYTFYDTLGIFYRASSANLQVCILNYKKNGESFWNHFFLEPIFDDSGVVEYYIGMVFDGHSCSCTVTSSLTVKKTACAVRRILMNYLCDARDHIYTMSNITLVPCRRSG